MSTIENLLIGVLAALLAAAIAFITATWRSKLVRRALTAVASTFLGVDVEYVFPQGVDAEPTIKEKLSRAQHIRVFAGRGNALQGDLFRPAFESVLVRKPFVQILLPDIEIKYQRIDWVESREREMATFDASFGHGTLRRQIDGTIHFLLPYVEPNRFEVRLYDLPLICRFVLTEEYLFLTPYSKFRHGRHCRVIQFGRGDIYDMFDRFFALTWEAFGGTALPTPSK
jgi:hypothetical protein